MFLTRKIGKILRGNSTPFQLIMACILWAMLGFVPGFSGAHTQAATLDELEENLHEVVEILLEDGEPALEVEFVGTQQIVSSVRAGKRTCTASTGSGGDP